jgi:hypothetical protein
MPAPRRFPPLRTVEETNDACYIVRDANGQALAYVYSEDKPGRRSAAQLFTRDKAPRIAVRHSCVLPRPPGLYGMRPR